MQRSHCTRRHHHHCRSRSPAPHLRRERVLGVAVGGVKVQRVTAPPGGQVGAGQHGRRKAEVPCVDVGVGAVGWRRAGSTACRARPAQGGAGRRRHPEQQLHSPGTVVGVHKDYLSACGVRSKWPERLVSWGGRGRGYRVSHAGMQHGWGLPCFRRGDTSAVWQDGVPMHVTQCVGGRRACAACLPCTSCVSPMARGWMKRGSTPHIRVTSRAVTSEQ